MGTMWKTSTLRYSIILLVIGMASAWASPVAHLQTSEECSDDSGAPCRRIVTNGAELRPGADLHNTDLTGPSIVLVGKNLSKTNLATADLSYVDLTGANLSGANLRGADLTGAILTDVDLSSADLSDAIIMFATFTRTKLSGATLRGALCSADTFTLAQLDTVDVSEDIMDECVT